MDQKIILKMNLNLVILALILALMTVPGVHAIQGEGDFAYLIDINQTSFLPSTIHSGDNVAMALQLHNRGTNLSITDLNATLDFGNAFEAVKGTDTIAVIQPDAVKTMVFQFKVKPGTISGFYPVLITFNYSRDGQAVVQTQTIQIPVALTQKNLDITVTPNVISPASPTPLTISVRNLSEAPISNLSVSWIEKNNLILPLGSDNQRYLPELAPGQQSDVSYTVVADPNVATGVYSLDVTVSWIDSNGVQSKTSQVGLIVGGATDFETSVDSQTSGQLSVSIANVGANNAGAVVVKIPQQPGIVISGSNVAILGNINKGDFTLANFQVLSGFDQNTSGAFGGARGNRGQGFGAGIEAGNGSTTGTSPSSENSGGTGTGFGQGNSRTLQLEIDYTDTTGQRQTVTKSVPLNSSSGSQGGALSGRSRQSNSLPLIPAGLFVLILAGALWFNFKMAGKKPIKKLAMVLIAIALLFGASIFFFQGDLLAVALAFILSIAILIWFFKINLSKIQFWKKG